MNKPQFIEDFMPKNVDPLASPAVQEFDWEEVAERLGDNSGDASGYSSASEALKRILEWVVMSGKRITTHTVGIRCCAFLWALDTSYFEGSSLRSLAKRLNCPFETLSRHASDARRTFGLRNRNVSHDWRTKHNRSNIKKPTT